MKRQSTTTNNRSFVSALSAAWADMHNASRRLVEHQMGPVHQHHR